jgi:hypothetical protein
MLQGTLWIRDRLNVRLITLCYCALPAGPLYNADNVGCVVRMCEKICRISKGPGKAIHVLKAYNGSEEVYDSGAS